MRIIGEIPHPIYKITVFKMNERLSVKIEDKLLEQIYKFRDGSGINTTSDIVELLDEVFLQQVDTTFKAMSQTYQAGLESRSDDEDEFEIDII